MNQPSSDALSNAEHRHLIEALFDFEAMPGRYPLTLREPRALFDRSHQVLLLAAGRPVEGFTLEPADAPRVQRAACFFVRMAMLRPGADHYTLLGLPPDFQEDALRDHYRLLMRLTHPDFAGTANAWPGDAATRVNQANDVLSSRVQRTEYERQLASAAPRRIPVNSLAAVLPRTSRQHRPVAWGWGLAAGGVGALVLTLMQWTSSTDDSELAQATQAAPKAVEQAPEPTQTVLTAAVRETRQREPAPDAALAQAAKTAKAKAAQAAKEKAAQAVQVAQAEQAAKAKAAQVVQSAQAAQVAQAEQAAKVKADQAAKIAQAEQAAKEKAAQAVQLAQAGQAAREKTVRAAQMAQVEQAAKAKAAQAAQLAQAEQAVKEKAVQTAVQVAKAEQAAKVAQAAQLAQAEQAAKAKAAQVAEAEQAAKAQAARAAQAAQAAQTAKAAMAVVLAASPVIEPARNPSLAEAQLAMGQLIQAMQGGRGEELLSGLDRSVRQSEGATGLVNAYNLLVGDSRAVRLGPVQLRSHPNADQLVVDGIVQLVLHDQGQPPPVRELRLRALFAQRGGQVVMTELSTGGARP